MTFNRLCAQYLLELNQSNVAKIHQHHAKNITWTTDAQGLRIGSVKASQLGWRPDGGHPEVIELTTSKGNVMRFYLYGYDPADDVRGFSPVNVLKYESTTHNFELHVTYN